MVISTEGTIRLTKLSIKILRKELQISVKEPWYIEVVTLNRKAPFAENLPAIQAMQ